MHLTVAHPSDGFCEDFIGFVLHLIKWCVQKNVEFGEIFAAMLHKLGQLFLEFLPTQSISERISSSVIREWK